MNLFLPWVTGIVLGTWLLLFLWARSATEKVKNQTTDLILKQARRAMKRSAPPTMEQFYADFQPMWEEMLQKSAKVILHKSELFPVRARPEAVRQQLNLTPAWMGAYLRINGYHLAAAEGLESEIQHIVTLANSKQPPR